MDRLTANRYISLQQKIASSGGGVPQDIIDEVEALDTTVNGDETQDPPVVGLVDVVGDLENSVEDLDTTVNGDSTSDPPVPGLVDRVEDMESVVSMSTTEHEVGTWIDGRTIYEKVVDLGDLPTSATSPNNSKEVQHNITGVDMFISVSGFMYGPQGSDDVLTGNLPFAPSPDGLTLTVTLYANRSTVTVVVGFVRSGFKAYAVLRYVKVVTP